MKREPLLYRRLSLTDLPNLLDIMLDAKHMAYSTHFKNKQQCETYLQMLASQWQTLGFGCWTILEKSSNATIGWGGIMIDENDPGWGPELIYYISPEYCGRGYASQLASTALQFAFDELDLPKVAAFAHPDNIASQKVLAKAGFEFCAYLEDMNRNYYEARSDV
ncbi:MAG: GNAT family N-acetyltransferase [Deinococcota bacterium]